MNTFLFVCVTVVASLTLTSQRVEAQQPLGCKDALLNVVKNCMAPLNNTVGDWVFFSSNGSCKAGPTCTAKDMNLLQTQLCPTAGIGARCIGFESTRFLNTSCADPSNRPILEAFGSYIQTYNTKCVDKCVFEVVDKLRGCYTTSSIDIRLFLGNVTKGEIIGETKDETSNFCQKKDNLFSCLQSTFDGCPVGRELFPAFDLDSYKKGINILCKKQDVYLLGLPCFAAPTAEVQACIGKNEDAQLQLGLEARAKNWTNDKVIEAECKLTVDQLKCDLNAWSKAVQRKEAGCTASTLGLRRQVECELFPQVCVPQQTTKYDATCASAGGVAGSSGGGGGTAENRGNSLLQISTFLVLSLSCVLLFLVLLGDF